MRLQYRENNKITILSILLALSVLLNFGLTAKALRLQALEKKYEVIADYYCDSIGASRASYICSEFFEELKDMTLEELESNLEILK